MKAIQIDRYGGPDTLTYRDIPKPTPGHGEVLIRLAYSGINFMDIHTRHGKYAKSRTYPMTLPVTLGIEGAGHVTAVGYGVEDLRVGDHVAYCIVRGSYAEFAAVPAWQVVKVPPTLPLEMAAASVFHGFTAHYLVNDVGRLGPGATCLVHAASGGIGQILVQLAKRRGARVLATTSTDEKADVARARGADEVFLYEQGRFAERVRDATGGRGVDVVFDSVGRATLRDSLRATRRKGLVVNYGTVSGSVDDLDPIELGEGGSLFLTRPRLADHLEDAPTIRRRAGDLFDALLEGSVKIDVAARYPFDRAAEGLAALEERRMTGKPLLVIDP